MRSKPVFLNTISPYLLFPHAFANHRIKWEDVVLAAVAPARTTIAVTAMTDSTVRIIIVIAVTTGIEVKVAILGDVAVIAVRVRTAEAVTADRTPDAMIVPRPVVGRQNGKRSLVLEWKIL